VVAIDPAITSTKDSDETGIIVAGLGYNGCGYILADLSRKASPQEWARIAVEAYHQYQADRIVAEVNNGGALVESVIRTVDSTVSYKAVHAARGKVARAEPVCALYEQERVFHVRLFKELEEQMVTWTPDSRKSPDRVDALVWALTELMLEPGYVRRYIPEWAVA
jgi:predicted phage terminase large subunit-like protein